MTASPSFHCFIDLSELPFCIFILIIIVGRSVVFVDRVLVLAMRCRSWYLVCLEELIYYTNKPSTSNYDRGVAHPVHITSAICSLVPSHIVSPSNQPIYSGVDMDHQ